MLVVCLCCCLLQNLHDFCCVRCVACTCAFGLTVAMHEHIVEERVTRHVGNVYAEEECVLLVCENGAIDTLRNVRRAIMNSECIRLSSMRCALCQCR